MKKSLFAMLLAVIMVAAVIFIAAPATKAETEADITLSADTTQTLVIDSDKVLNLNGFNATVSVNKGVTLTIVDTKFMEGDWNLKGTSAGILTVAEGSEGTIKAWAQFGDYKYLAVKNGNTYSAHPFNIMLTNVGVNTHSSKITVGITVVADDVVAALIDSGEFGLHNITLDGQPNHAEYENRYAKHPFAKFDGKNGLQVYFDLNNSLSKDVLTENRSNEFGAYIKVNAGYDEEVIVESKSTTKIAPKAVLDSIANKYSTLSPTDKALMQKLMISSDSVKTYLSSVSVPVEETTTGYVKITSANQLTSGKYVLVAEGGYAPTILNGSWVEVGQPIVDKFGTITAENATAFLWTLTVDGDSVVLMDANNKSIAPEGGNENGIKEGEYSWAFSFENGVFSFSGTGEDTVTLACNKTSNYKIKAYKNDTAKGYPHTFALYKETEIVVCKHTNASAATCTETSVCQDCGITVSAALGHADVNYDHICDNGCNEPQGECGDFDNNGFCDYGFGYDGGCNKTFEITDEPAEPVSATLNFADAANRTISTTTEQVWEQNGIKLTYSKNNYNNNLAEYANPVRFYAGTKITIEFSGMTKIEFTCNSAAYATTLASCIDGATANGSVVTVNLAAAANSFSFVPSAQVRVNSLTVSNAPVCEHPNTTTTTVAATCTEAGSTTVTCDDCGKTVSTEEIAALEHNFVDGKCNREGCDATVSTGGENEKFEVKFELGANGSASHADGSSKTSYSETVDGYTLSLTSGTNMYTGARDAKGNSCIKLGTSSKAGSFSFTVGENVTSVTIYVAKYKSNTSKVTINGTTYTLTKSSDAGEYDAITIDTSTTKTITLTTISGGYRAMVNTIVFKGVTK